MPFLNALRTGGSRGVLVGRDQLGAAESSLDIRCGGCEDRLVIQGHLDRFVRRSVVERRRDQGELEDVGKRLIFAMDGSRVEGKQAVVKVHSCRIERDPGFERDGSEIRGVLCAC